MKRHLVDLALRGLARGTIDARRRALRRMAAALPGGDLLAAGEADLRAWRAGLQRLSAQTIGGYVSHANRFYAWALEQGLISVNPAARLPVPKRPRRVPRPIAEHDLMAALAAAPARVRPWLVLAGWAGLRAKEIALLRRECVLEWADPPVILIAAEATKGTRERVVPLAPWVVAELGPLLPARGWVFARADGRPGPNAPWTVCRLANRHLHEMGIPATLHQLRHRFGTQAYRAVRDLRAVQEMMGHNDTATTAAYALYDAEQQIAAVRALPVPPTGGGARRAG